MKRLMALMALMTLTACDRAEQRDLRREREDRLYQEAMADYGAGRLESAIKAFEKTIRNDPGHGAARFQLACLQQDSRKDYLAAFCGYYEYLRLKPKADKVKLAQDRMRLCEREVARVLAQRHGLNGNGAMSDELAALQRDLKAAALREEKLKAELTAARERTQSLETERTRLLAMLKGQGMEKGDRPSVREVKDLLEEEDTDDRIKNSADVAALRGEGENELSSGSELLPSRSAEPAKAPAATPPPSAPPTSSRPTTYTVQDGDTLIRLAERFYGRPSAWKQIREANKATISNDGRIRTGDVIRLP